MKQMTVSHGQISQSCVRLNSSVFSRCLKQESDVDVFTSGGQTVPVPHTTSSNAEDTVIDLGTSSADVDVERSGRRQSVSDTDRAQLVCQVLRSCITQTTEDESGELELDPLRQP